MQLQWEELLGFAHQSYLMIVEASISATVAYHGLVPGQFYTLLTCVELANGAVKLCLLRNPWSSLPLSSDWSYDSPRWTSELKSELRSALNQRNQSIPYSSNDAMSDNSLFWVSYDELCQWFSSIIICMVKRHLPLVSSNGMTDRTLAMPTRPSLLTWHSQYIQCIGDITSPVRYAFDIEDFDGGDIILSLHQDSPQQQELALTVYREVVSTSTRQKKFVPMLLISPSSSKYQQSEKQYFPNGRYFIILYAVPGDGTRVPCGDRRYPRVPLITSDAHDNATFTQATLNAYQDIFVQLDSDRDGFVTYDDLSDYYYRIGKDALPIERFNYLHRTCESSTNKGLSFDAFIKAQCIIFNETSGDEDELYEDLQTMGCEHHLHQSLSNVTVVIHSSTAMFRLSGQSLRLSDCHR